MTNETLIQNPTERNQRFLEKRLIILRFLRTEIYTTAAILQSLINFKSVQAVYQTLQKMERDGLIVKAEVPLVAGRKLFLFGITYMGLAFSFTEDEDYHPSPVFHPSKVNTAQLQHKLDIQFIHIKVAKAGWQWQDGSKIGMRGKQMKIPDALATSPSGQKIAIEIERTIKSHQRYKEIIVSHLVHRKQGYWDKIYYLSPTLEFTNSLEKVIKSQKKGKYNDKTFEFTPALFDPFVFKSYNTVKFKGG